MKRNLELVEPLPAKIEDCFAQFDKVFDSLASQLEWEEAAPAPAVHAETLEKPAAPENTAKLENADTIDATAEAIEAIGDAIEAASQVAEPGTQMALATPKPMVPAPPLPPAPEPPVDVLKQFERAFSVLDDKLAEAESEGAGMSAKLAPRLKRQLPSDRRAALRPVERSRFAGNQFAKAKKVRRARTFDDVFGVLENLSVVRRRGQLAEERHLLSRLLADTRQLCADLELQSAKVRVEFAVLTLENEHFDKLDSELDELARHIRHDLRFCAITPGRRSR
jgi:hypothetical protein